MGFIHAALGAATGVLSDQWKEYFYCDSLNADILVAKGQKRTSLKSSNYGTDNIITNGSVISVADGQCVLIVDNGKVVDYCAEPGEYKYDASSEPSLFDGGKLADNIKKVFENMGKRFTFGGEAPKDQRIYYFNTKELPGSKYGTANPVPFRVVDPRANIDIDVSVKCFGEYSIRLTNPILFYTNVCGNVANVYRKAELDAQMKSEFLTALQPAFAQISARQIRYSELPAHTQELADAMNEQLSSKWRDLRGIEVVSCGVNSIVADEKDEDMLKSLQRAAALKDPELGKGYLAGQFGQAAVDAANNEKGSDVLGVGIVNGVAGGVAGGIYGGTAAAGDDTAAFKAKVEKLAMMKEAGLLTEEEFAAMKKELLASIL
ncbi:MAG: SPFH domain-containing protein [Firmicutes bacterium]|nr:SPFH domain-containing protein [Bacillota bacterium]